MFRVITVAHEYGTGGSAIAQSVAKRLGWRLLDDGMAAAVARTAQVGLEIAQQYDEVVDSWWQRFNRRGLWCAAIEAGANPDQVQFYDAEAIASFASEVIMETAARGECVIVGRGSQCVLENKRDAFHVFVHAPWAQRVQRIRKRTQTDRDIPELLRSADELRARYIQTYFGRNWKDVDLYHMMVNSQVGIETVARSIAHAVEDAAVAAFSPSIRGYAR